MSRQRISLDNLKILKSQHVHMKNHLEVLQKINRIIFDGSEKLQLIVDFDFTLTKQHQDGAVALSSMNIFEKSLPQARTDELEEVRKKYQPIEVDPKIPIEDRITAMKEWFEIEHKLLSGLEYNQKKIEAITRKYGHSLRDRTKELFSKLKIHNIPILVFSAGLGDVVELLLRQHDVPLDNVKIISNFLQFEGNKLMGLKNHENVIHTFNKNVHSNDHEYFKFVQARKNIILLGDSIADTTMADGIENIENLLKIGFLYNNIEEKLPFYIEAFDIVLVDDQTMNVILDILHFMF
ncbi:7-methylguanosine phosphate-specific 5'-nucleotidase-like [Phymastichus coffea]|uniref:7-methylguanosine phosphate-specific 5'-nucleotidase-like n=1 Tax=Phymastichus coffea TaxID=108790 RepID=UPI00273B94B1|nr:7-methylguanosine phosphate-specific 5'-nucleotidase-like [Phymastichus coffea]